MPERLLLGLAVAPFLVPFVYYIPAVRSMMAGWITFSDFGDIAVLVALPIFLLAPFCFVVARMPGELNTALAAASVSVFGLMYIGGSLLCLWILWLRNFGSLLVLHVLLVVWCGDIAAYYVGKNMGHRKLAPRISPGKTWEGTIASALAGGGLGTLILFYLQPIYDQLFRYHLVPDISWVGWSSPLPRFPLWFAVTASLTINIAAQLGDLVESAIKRGANVKDSGGLLPGHGGLLDRVDALLFANPVAMLVFALGIRFFGSKLVF